MQYPGKRKSLVSWRISCTSNWVTNPITNYPGQPT